MTWDYAEGTAGHTVTYCGESCDDPVESPLFDSGKLLAGEAFTFTFDEPGRYLYLCEFHPVAMRASILVQPAQTSTPGLPTATDPAPPLSATAAVTPGSSATPASLAGDSGASESGSDGSPTWLLVAIATAAALGVLGAAAFVFHRARG